MKELETGMVFENLKELCNFSGITYNSHSSYLKTKIKQICSFHIINNVIYIDNVFGRVNDIEYNIKGYLYNINEIIHNKFGDIKILNQTRIIQKNENSKAYGYVCLKDGYKGMIRESHLKHGVGCPVCSSHECVAGINSLADTRPDLIKYITNKNDAYNYMANSGDKVLCKCPECGDEKFILLSNLSKFGFSCSYCSDGISYPNKFIYNLLKQLNTSYTTEKTFLWSNNRKYDAYLNNYNILIENHGLQHYEDCFSSINGARTLEEEQENDRLKEQLAKDNGVENYIVLDCRKSESEWIKKSVMESELSTLFNFNEEDIDWIKCHEFASKSIIKEVCEFWNNNNKNVSIASEYYNLDPHTVIDYLKKGRICGYCDYEKGFADSKSFSNISRTCKPIYNIDYDIYFFSRFECEDYFKSNNIDKNFNSYHLYRYINNNKTYHGFTFEYVDKNLYNNKKDNYINDSTNPIVIGNYYNERYIKEE